MKNILLISKDVLRRDYLSCYGSKVCHTPNIDRLAEEGTIFTSCCTPAPSTSMAITCMFSGLYAHELLDRKDYTEVEPFTQAPTLFSLLEGGGYETHVVWTQRLFNLAWRYSKMFPPNTQVHNLEGTGTVIPHDGNLPDERDGTDVERFEGEIRTILNNSSKPVFIWVHLPHVLSPRGCFGSDMDLLDRLVGDMVSPFAGNIYLTADHGNMSCEKGALDYGFHVYEGAVRVPLITPRVMGRDVIEEPVSLVQLKSIILERVVRPPKYVYSDSQYYQQPNRKLAIRKGDFKYIYNKIDKSEELYDLSVDPGENANLLVKDWYDPDRKRTVPLDQLYYYKRWDEAETAYGELRGEKDRIWRTESRLEALVAKAKVVVARDIRRVAASRKTTGRWESAPKAMEG